MPSLSPNSAAGAASGRYTAMIEAETDSSGQPIEGFIARAANASEALAKAKAFFAGMGVTSPRFLSLRRQEFTRRWRHMPAMATFTRRYVFVPLPDIYGDGTQPLTIET